MAVKLVFICVVLTLFHNSLGTSDRDRAIDQIGGFAGSSGDAGFFGEGRGSSFPGGRAFGLGIGIPNQYPGTSFPGGDINYPGSPVIYGTGSLGSGLTYPGSSWPYTRSDLTYPGSGPTYPGSGLTYPGGDLTYPGSDLTYPGSSWTYPGSGLTYPNSNFQTSYGRSFGRWWCTCRKGGCRYDEWRVRNTCRIPFFPWFFRTCCKWLPNWRTENF